MAIKVLLVDDHGILRSGIELIINQTDDMEIIGQATNGLESIALARELKPDIILMDISMPVLNGIDASKEILKENPDVKILALSAHFNKHFINQILTAGVSGYALKDELADNLIKAIRTVYSGERYLSKKVLNLVIDGYARDLSSKSAETLIDKLTTKEREVLQMLSENKTTKEVAKLLCISAKTVEARRLNIMKKLNISGIADLTKLAIKEGITSVDF